MRRGATLLEALLALAFGAAVLAGVIGLTTSVTRFSRAGELAGALQEEALAMGRIELDVLRALPGPGGELAVRIAAQELKMAHGRFNPDGKIVAALVRYETVAQPEGGFRLRRTGDGRSTLLAARLDGFRFERLGGPGGPYLRVTLHAAGQATPAPAGATPGATPPPSQDPAVLSMLLRLAGPELASSPFYGLEFLDDVKSIPGP